MRSLGVALRKTKKVFRRAVAKAAAAGTSVRFTNKEVCYPVAYTWPVGIWLQPLGGGVHGVAGLGWTSSSRCVLSHCCAGGRVYCQHGDARCGQAWGQPHHQESSPRLG